MRYLEEHPRAVAAHAGAAAGQGTGAPAQE